MWLDANVLNKFEVRLVMLCSLNLDFHNYFGSKCPMCDIPASFPHGSVKVRSKTLK